MGGRGNIASVVSALRSALTAKLGRPRAEVDPWYSRQSGNTLHCWRSGVSKCPSPTTSADLRPLKEGEEGLREWIRMFCSEFLAGLDSDIENAVLTLVEEELRPTLFDGVRWVVDYRRLRFQARKIGMCVSLELTAKGSHASLWAWLSAQAIARRKITTLQ